jgi:multiple sugar transport system ATP-binding protein
MAEIRLEGVTRRYGAVTALDDVTVTIASGTFTSVFGPPGSGKSVLLRVLLGLEQPDAGRILIDGQDVTALGPAERNLAMVFQNLALFPQLTARQNVLFPMRRRKTPAAEVTARLDQIAASLGIAHILHKRPGQLSGGERQRVAIARALIRDAAAWMMDEPIAALDARMRDAARIELKRLQHEQGRTFIYVTHDSDEAMSVADRMIILNQGRVIQTGTPDDIYSRPAQADVAVLVGAPRINLLDTAARDGVAQTPFGPVRLPAGQDDRPMQLAIRPEALRIAPDGALQATVVDIERLGGATIIGLGDATGDTRLRLIADTAVRAQLGDRLRLAVDPGGLHLFDRHTGQRIGEGAVS